MSCMNHVIASLCIDNDIEDLGEPVLIPGEVKCIDKDIKHLGEQVLIPV